MLNRHLLRFMILVLILTNDFLSNALSKNRTSPIISIANSFLGIPYRQDGAENIFGNYTSFNHPERIFTEPGLNCSGFLLSVVRHIYQKSITIKMLERDRNQDSGVDSSMGHDWDYGFDVIWNLVEATEQKARLILPRQGNWDRARGFNLHKMDHWDDVLRQIKPGSIYLLSINKDTRKPGYQRIFYHVGMIIPENAKHAWFYHATKKSNVHRMDLKSRAGLDRFFYQFAESRMGPKYAYILEIPEPNLVN